MTAYRFLGGSGVRVSPLTLGTMMFGAWGNRDHDECVRIIHRALDAGINIVDTADVYSAGESEEIVGDALAGGRREDVILATKFHGRMGEAPNRGGNSRRWIMRAVEDSLRRLRTDWIDLYQVHRWDPETDLDETLGALSDLVSAGKVRMIGTSTIIGPRTMEQLESQLGADEIVLDDAVLDRIDEIVPPGTTVNPVDDGWTNPALAPEARRR